MGNRVHPGYFGNTAYAQWEQYGKANNGNGLPMPTLTMGAYTPNGQLIYTDNEEENYRVFGGKRLASMESAAHQASGGRTTQDGKLTKQEMALYMMSMEEGRVSEYYHGDVRAGAAEFTNNFFAFHDVNNDGIVSVGEMAAKTMLETNIVGSLRNTLTNEESTSGVRQAHRTLYHHILHKGDPQEVAWLLTQLGQHDDIEFDAEEINAIKLINDRLKSPGDIRRSMENSANFNDAMESIWAKVADAPEAYDTIPFSEFEQQFKGRSALLDGRYLTPVGQAMVEEQWLHPPGEAPNLNIESLQDTIYNNNRLGEASKVSIKQTTSTQTTTGKQQASSNQASNNLGGLLGGGILIFALFKLLGGNNQR